MKRLKRFSAILLAVFMLLSMMSVTASATEGDRPTEPMGQLVLGSTTTVMPDMLEGWTNGAQNAAMYRLMYETLSTMSWTSDGVFVENPTVLSEPVVAADNEDGSRTYTVKINEGLVYNDGSPITATDFVFKLMLDSCPEAAEIDRDASSHNEFVGYEEFNTGATKTFAGVGLADDYTFTITVAAEHIPYHFEINYYTTYPLPMAVIAPDCTITDSGEGATFSDNFTADVLRANLVEADNGYRYKPLVTPGAYQFVSYEPSTYEAVLEVNPNYPGTYQGVKPLVKTIILREVVEETEIDELGSGIVDMLSGMSGGDKINAGLDLVDAGTVEYIEFPRNGYGKIEFACEFGPTQFAEVRRAIAWCLDRDEFARQYTGGYGTLIDTNAGLAQKEYVDNQEALNTALTHYTLDLDKAVAELEAGGFVLDKDGNAFNPDGGLASEGNVRYKELEDGSLMALEVEWCSSGNAVSTMLNTMLPGEADKIGMRIIENQVDFNTLLDHLYRTEVEPKYHMFNLGSNFSEITPYWYYFNPGENYLGLYNTERIQDEELYALADQMRVIPYEDEAAWQELWVKMVTRYNELVVNLPLYSDLYHTFFNPKLQNFSQTSIWNWEYAIIDAWVTE